MPEKAENLGIGARVKEIRIAEIGADRGAPAKFAKRIGESPQNVDYWEAGHDPRLPKCIRIADEFGYSLDWLLRGRGPKKVSDAKKEIPSQLIIVSAARGEAYNQTTPPPETVVSDDFAILPVLSNPVAAGPGYEISDEDIEGPGIIHKSWCPHPSETDYVRVKGDSMEQAIPDGALVTIDKHPTPPSSLIGKVVAIYRAEYKTVTIKRLFVESDIYMAVPDNPRSSNPDNCPFPIQFDKGDRIVGHVRSVHAKVT